MAKVSIDGWIAEGGHTIIEGVRKNNIVLFDVIEDSPQLNGVNDVYNNNNAWFHCCFEVNIEEGKESSFIPSGYVVYRIQKNGWAWLKKDGSKYEFYNEDIFLHGEQIAEFIQEGKRISVSGYEYLLEGMDGKILRVIDVTDISFEPCWVRENTKSLKVPYRTDLYVSKAEEPKKEEKDKENEVATT